MKISKVKGRNLYSANVPKPDGGYKKVYGKTKKEVREKANSLAFDIRSGKFVERNDLTYSEWLDDWSENYLINVSQSTKLAYDSIIRNHLKPFFKDKPIQKITHNDVQTLIQKLSAKLAPKSVKNIHLVVHRSLKDAKINGYIPFNPSDDIILPKQVKQEMLVLNKEEIHNFLDLAYKTEPEYADCFEFLILTGLRLSEFIGLTEDSYNVQKGTLKIDKQYQVPLKQFTPPKHGVTRTIVLPPRAAEIINSRIEENKVFEGVKEYNPNKLIFCNSVGTFFIRSTLLKALRRVSSQIGYPTLRIHDLRHTFATLSLDSGVDIKTVQKLLGHADATFTMNKYAHSTDLMNIDASKKINDYLQNLTQN